MKEEDKEVLRVVTKYSITLNQTVYHKYIYIFLQIIIVANNKF